jgi:hypothetical protein
MTQNKGQFVKGQKNQQGLGAFKKVTRYIVRSKKETFH